MSRKPSGKEKFKAVLKGTPKNTRLPSPSRLYLVMALVTVVILVGGYLFYYFQEQQMLRRFESGLSTVAQLKAEQIAEWRAERLVNANILVGSPFFAGGVAEFMASPTDTEIRDKVLVRLAIIEEAYTYQDILLTDVNGSVLLSLNDSVHRLSNVTLAQLAVAIKGHKAVMTDFHYLPDSSSPHLDVVAPLFPWGQDSQPAIGAVVFCIDPSQYLWPMVQSLPVPSETAETFLVERDGDQVLFLNDLRFQKDTALKLRIPLSQQENSAVMAVLGEEGVVEGKDYRGAEVLAALKHVPDSPWYIVTKIDAGEILSAWRSRAGITIASVFVLLAAALAVTGLIWQRRQRLAYQALYQAEVEAQALRSHFEYLVKYANDIILLVDEDYQIVEANDRALETYGYRREEMLGLPLAALIPPGDLSSYWERLRKIQQKGAIVAEVIHQRKDGSTFPVETSARSIEIEGKSYIQAIIRDITERKRAEHEKSTILDTMSELVIYQDLEHRVVLANRSAGESVGLAPEDLVGRYCYEIWHRRSLPCVNCPVVQARETGKLQENEMSSPDGRFWLVRGYPVTDPDGVVIGAIEVTQDITERKQAEERIQHLNLVLRAIRNVNQLIARGTDRDSLLKGVCENFVNTRGYYNAWIALLDESGKLITAAEAGLSKNFRQMIERLKRGELPHCGQKALKKTGVVVIKDPVSACADCPLAKGYSDRCAMSVRLEYGGKVYGLMTVSVLPGIAREKEEQEMLEEVAGDISFALNSMEQERERKKSEVEYQTIIRTAMDGFWLADMQGHFLDVNEAYCNLIGYSRDELLNMSISDVEAIERPRETAKHIRKIKEVGYDRFESRHRRKDGEIVDVEVGVNYLSTGGGRLFVFLRDITERKQSENELRKSEERYRTLFGQSRDAVSITSREGKFVDVNQSMLDLFGYTREEMIGMDVREIYVGPADRKKLQQEIERKGFITEYEVRHRKKDGTEMDCLVTSTVRQADDKSILGYQGIIRDVTERKQIEKLSSDLIHSSHLGIYIIQDRKFKLVSPTFCETTGYTEDELLNIGPLGIIHPEDREMVRENAVKMLKGERSSSYEYRYICKNGESRWVAEQVTSIEYQGNRATLGSFMDITDRKQADQALQQSEVKYRTILKEMEDSYFEVDLAGNFTFVNDSICRNLGYSREEMAGMNYRTFTAQEDIEHVYHAFEQVYRTGKPNIGFPWKSVRKDGSTGFVEATVSLVRNLKGEIIGFRGVGRDITERKKAEEALRESESKYRTLIENLPQKIFLKDRNSVYISCNENYARDLNIKAAEIAGKTDYDFHPRELAEKYRSDDRRVLESASTEDLEEKYFVDGQELFVHTVKTPVKNENGETIGILGFFRDITKRKRAEEHGRQLEQKAQIASRLASVGEMVAGVAHEINNPLTGVIGYAQLLVDREDIPQGIRSDLAAINECAQRVAGIVKRLLTFSRQTKPERKLVDINELIESTLVLRAYYLTASNIKVNTRLAPDLPETVVDPGQIQQVLLNLIVNAETEMKLAHGRGKLTIATEKSDNTIKICVKDNGPGIKPEIMDRIFDPFFTTREVGQGTGLGLSLCYGIITEHNGKIYAESKPGKGATFVVELPIVTEVEPLKPPEPVIEEPEKAVKARMLVVDDEQVVRDLVKQVLVGEGYEVDTVDNADDALKKIEIGRYNLILLDIKMPGISGVELYRTIQKIARSLARRVVFITGDVMAADTEKFLSETKVPHIAKPFDAEQLKRGVKRALTGGR